MHEDFSRAAGHIFHRFILHQMILPSAESTRVLLPTNKLM